MFRSVHANPSNPSPYTTVMFVGLHLFDTAINVQWQRTRALVQSRLIGSSFDVPSKLRATSARRSSLSGAILLDMGLPVFPS